MKCPECGKEMREGYLFCSKDGAFSFANEVPGVFENAKNADGFVKITDLKASHRTRVPASICEECRTVMLKYCAKLPFPTEKVPKPLRQNGLGTCYICAVEGSASDVV